MPKQRSFFEEQNRSQSVCVFANSVEKIGTRSRRVIRCDPNRVILGGTIRVEGGDFCRRLVRFKFCMSIGFVINRVCKILCI